MKPRRNKYCITWIVLLFALSVINLLFMHAFFRYGGYLGLWPYAYSAPVNFFVTVMDVSLLLLFFLLITWGRIRMSLSFCFFFTLIWSFVNVFYGSFFSQYLPLSAIKQIGSLTDGLVVDSMLAGLRWLYCFYLLSICIYFVIIRKTPQLRLSRKMCLGFISLPLICLFCVFAIYTGYHFAHPTMRHNMELYKSIVRGAFVAPEDTKNSFPNDTRYHTGVLRILFSDIKDLFYNRELTQDEKNMVSNVYLTNEGRVSDHEINEKLQNVIFIVLESFLSASLDLKVDGKEITPFLNSLKNDSSVYYNGHVVSNITIGESGDGQFIYMTGLLPLRNKLTVGEAKTKKLYALPNILKECFGIKYAEIILPTTTQMWQQDAMNTLYGIDKAYQNIDVVKDRDMPLNDKQVFDLAMNTDKKVSQPSFSMILTVDTHQPYREPVISDFSLEDKNFPDSYKNYLIACHQVDRLINAYFSHLKQIDMYDNSLIVIVSDHHAHMDALGMGDKITPELPLYIINGNIDPSAAWKGPCNQLDVFTTILDVLNIDCEWKGLGHTLLSPNYKNSVTHQIWDVSECIIEGNFFCEISF